MPEPLNPLTGHMQHRRDPWIGSFECSECGGFSDIVMLTDCLDCEQGYERSGMYFCGECDAWVCKPCESDHEWNHDAKDEG